MLSRLKAMLVNFAAALGFVLCAALCTYMVWYPAPLDGAAGVDRIFLIVLIVSLVVGPLLTFLIFNPKKKVLVYDLISVVALQLLAFGYGVWTIAAGRPAWIVFNVDRFDLVRANEIDARRLDEAAPEYRQPSYFGVGWVAALIPEDVEVRNQIMFEALMAGSDVAQRPDRYVSLHSELVNIRDRSLPLRDLVAFNTELEVEEALQQWPRANAWLPLMSKAKALVVLIERETGDIVAVVDLKPWG